MDTKYMKIFLRGISAFLLAATLIGMSPGGALAAPGDITRVSVDSSGTQANAGSRHTTISGDGRYVAFASDASNLVDGDTNEATDIFVHDRQTGVTTRVSVDSSGAQANGGSDTPVISNDGRYVAFY